MSPKALSPVRRTTLAREVVERLRRAILTGGLAGGQRVLEAQTAGKLGVSRVPVREALVELEKEGLVVFDPRGQACVRDFTADDFEEIVSLRSTLQVMSAKIAALKHTDEDLERLEAILARADRTTDATEFSLLDIAFHTEIVVIARHQRLLQFWSSLRSQMELWLARAHREHEKISRDVRDLTLGSHRGLIDVLKSRDAGLAAAQMETHCKGLWARPSLEA